MCTEDELRKKFDAWEEEMMTKNEDGMWIANNYWYLEKVSCVLSFKKQAVV